MAVGLLQRFAADAFCLSEVNVGIGGRFAASRAAAGRSAVMDHHEHERSGPSRVAFLPDGANDRQARLSVGRSDQNFHGRGPIAQGQANCFEGAATY